MENNTDNTEIDVIYKLARRVLLDALEALCAHIDSLILIGAQAVYFHINDPNLSKGAYTKDADLIIESNKIAEEPKIGESLKKGGFELDEQGGPGHWIKSIQSDKKERSIPVDLMVPSSLLERNSRRQAKLKGHEGKVARKVDGTECVLIDKEPKVISSFEPDTNLREYSVNIAGPTSLIVAKLFKIYERAVLSKDQSRLNNKDALDIYRLLQIVDTDLVVQDFNRFLEDSKAKKTAEEGLNYLSELFGSRGAIGVKMLSEALGVPSNRAQQVVIEIVDQILGNIN